MKNKSFHYVFSSLISGISGFILISILTKSFNPVIYGEYSIVIITVSLLNTVLVNWLTQSLLRMYDKSNKEGSEVLLKTSMIILTTIWLSFLFIIIILYNFSNLDIYLIPIFFLFISESLYLFSCSLYRTVNDAKKYNMLVSLSWISKISLLIIFVNLEMKNIFYIIVGLALPNILICSMVFFQFISKFTRRNKIYSHEIFQQTFSYGASLIGLASMQWIMSSSDRFVLKFFNLKTELGIYSLAYSVSSNIYNVFITFLLLISYPIILKNYRLNQKAGAISSIKTHFNYFLVILIPATVGLSLLSKEAILLISTPEYVSGSTVLILTNISMVLYGMIFYINKVWELTKNTKTIFLNSLIAAATNFTLTFLLVPFLGGVGASLGTLMGYILFLFLSYYKSKAVMKLQIDIKTAKKIIYSSLAMGIIIYITKEFLEVNIITFVLVILVGVLTYLLFLKLFNATFLFKEFLK